MPVERDGEAVECFDRANLLQSPTFVKGGMTWRHCGMTAYCQHIHAASLLRLEPDRLRLDGPDNEGYRRIGAETIARGIPSRTGPTFRIENCAVPEPRQPHADNSPVLRTA